MGVIVPAIELAIALSAIATKAVVAELIRGTPMNRGAWADLATEIVGTLMTTSIRQESSLQRLRKQIDDIPVREFEQHMAAGRRYLRDLPADWRTAQDRRELIHDARVEFVHAVGTAELMQDVQRQALAEVAIAGCWLWVPSLPDVKNTIGGARRILEQEMLFGATLPTAAYADVLALCKSYGERTSTVVAPIIPADTRPSGWSAQAWLSPTPGARLAVVAKPQQWVECAGVQLRLDRAAATVGGNPPTTRLASTAPSTGLNIRPRTPSRATPLGKRGSEGWVYDRQRNYLRPAPPPPAPPDDGVTVTVRNTRAEWISVCRTADTVLVHLHARSQFTSSLNVRGLPAMHRVKPGTESIVTLLPLPPLQPETWVTLPGQIPRTPTIGFVLRRTGLRSA